MARPLRIEFAGALCRVPPRRATNGKPIYRDDRDGTRLLERLSAVAARLDGRWSGYF